ncbi:MAG: hypothetical protein ACC628_19525 [Pirellulaceae bacterium]
MKDFLLSPLPQVVIWMAVLSVMVIMAAYVVRRFRDRTGDNRQTANEILTNFRELHHQGDIDDAEFRTIKTVLGTKIQEESKDTDNEG